MKATHLLGVFVKFCEVATSFVLSIRPSIQPHGTTQLPLDGFSLNLISEYFFKICHENSSFINIWQE